MSGTSLDGIDVAVVDIAGAGWRQKVRVLAQATTPYPAAIRKALLAVSNAETHTAAIARLHFLLAELYAEAFLEVARAAAIPRRSVELIGCHGQTIYHQGSRSTFLGRRIACTLQIGDGGVLAERTGVPVISDFRTRDMAAGGRGAPLVPYVDYLLFRHRRISRVAVNIGGIANLTAIPAGAGPGAVIAFDTGPGNMVVDALVGRLTGGRRRFDRDGRMAASGQLNRRLLRLLLRDPYYAAAPPKSAGREQYGGEFIERLFRYGLSPKDLIATATALTPASIAAGVERFLAARLPGPCELVVSGGGAHNRQMMAHLGAFLPRAGIRRSSDFGIDVDAKEAIAFAILANESWRRRPANLPSATGARRRVVLGKLSV